MLYRFPKMNEDDLVLKRVNSLLIKSEFEKALTLINNSDISEYIKEEILGNYCFYKRDFDNAIHFFKRALEINPNAKLSRYHYLSGIGYERLKKYDDAFSHYVESIDIDPMFVDPYIDLGGMLGKLNEYEKAAKCYRDAIKITPNDIILYLNLKKILKKMNLNSVENQNELKNIENEIRRLEVLGIKAPPMNSW